MLCKLSMASSTYCGFLYAESRRQSYTPPSRKPNSSSSPLLSDAHEEQEYTTEKAIEESAAKIVPANSIMVGTRVGVGKVAVNTVAMSTSQDIISLLEIDESKWSKDYLCKYLQGKKGYLNSQARGATIKGIKIDVLSKLEVPEISLEDQIYISKIVFFYMWMKTSSWNLISSSSKK